MGRNVTVFCCAQRGIVRRQDARLLAAGVVAIAVGLSVGPAVRAAADHEAVYSFAGAVLDPQGKPVAGARVWFEYALARSPAQPVPADTVTDAEGKFQFTRAKSSLADMLELPAPTPGVLVATKEGFGFAAGPADQFETTGRLAVDRPKLVRPGAAPAKRNTGKTNPVLRLVPDDVPLQGQITDSRGEPVDGATVEVLAVWTGEGGNLDVWEAGMERRREWKSLAIVFNRYHSPEGSPFVGGRRWFGVDTQLWNRRAVPVAPVTSDDAGRFTLKGIGHERLVELLIRAERLETVHKFARTRAGAAIEMRNPNGSRTPLIAPSKGRFELGPSVPIEGWVVESGTKRALAGVHVVSRTALSVQTVTDAEGYYRLEGAPPGQVILDVIPPSESRNVPIDVNALIPFKTKGKRQEVPTLKRQNISLPVGVLVRGRVIDERTGKPVEGTLNYYVCETNPELKTSMILSLRNTGRPRHVKSDAEGRFAIRVLSGPGILAFRAGSQFHFGVGADQVDYATYGGPEDPRGKVFRTTSGSCQANNFNLLVSLNPPPQAKDMTVDLKLHSGLEVTARVRTLDGRPPGTYYVLGDAEEPTWTKHNEDRFTIAGCYPEETRRLFLYQPERNLVASADISGVPPEPIEIRLRPGGSVVGRLLDFDGKPPAGAYLVPEFAPLRAGLLAGAGHLGELKRDIGGVPTTGSLPRTDEKGHFEIKGLIPGLQYTARFMVERRGNVRASSASSGVMPIFTDLTVRSGETKDVGDVRAKPPAPRKSPKRRVLRRSGRFSTASTQMTP